MVQAVVEFLVQALAGIVGVFVGVWLALLADKRNRRQDQAHRDQELAIQFGRATQSLLGSVLKNMAEARRIAGLVDRRGVARVIHEGLEVSVWDATQDQFIQVCGSVDKRVLFAQFFNQVRHLQAFCNFHRDLQLTTAGAASEACGHLDAIAHDADLHLKDLAEDVILCGRLLIADHGEPIHRRLLGMKPSTKSDPATTEGGR
ncbi:MAG: hypothetical protein ACJ8GK_11285 [Luteimonas sp.]